MSLSGKRWYLSAGRIRELAPPPSEENNNDSGHNQFYAATARCALIWDEGSVFWNSNETNMHKTTRLIVCSCQI